MVFIAIFIEPAYHIKVGCLTAILGEFGTKSLIRLAYWLNIKSICFQVCDCSAYQVGSCVDTILIALDCAVFWKLLVFLDEVFDFSCFIDYVFCFYSCDFYSPRGFKELKIVEAL